MSEFSIEVENVLKKYENGLDIKKILKNPDWFDEYFTEMNLLEKRKLNYKKWVWIEDGNKLLPQKVSMLDNDKVKISGMIGYLKVHSKMYKIKPDKHEEFEEKIINFYKSIATDTEMTRTYQETAADQPVI